MSTEIRTPILVVGAGPAGLAASLLLQRYGVEALTVTRFPWTANTPRAHHLNPRAMEVMRGLGLGDRLRARAMPGELVANINWCVSLAGQELGRLATYHQGGADGYKDYTPCDALNIQQHQFEPVMAEAFLERGGKLLFNTECVSFTQDDSGVRARLRNRVTGAEFEVLADYLIGADGANSMIAGTLGLEFEGQEGWGAAVNIWIDADLEKYCAHRPGALYWTNLPGSDFWIGSGVFVAVKPWNEWMVTLMYDPREGDIDLSHDSLKTRIQAIIGDDRVDISIRSTGKWLMNAVYAREYSSGRVFCMGDAVHRHSPAGGLGANTCILDAANLAWKLKLVIEGTADASLLASYTAERQPIGKAVIERSMKNIGEFTRVAQALGYRPGQSEADGKAELAKLAAPGVDGEARRDALAEALKVQANQFNATSFELGYRYFSGALWDTERDPDVRDPDLPYVPDTAPGYALPHVWIADTAGRRLSTIDIVADGDFHLLTGPGGEGWGDVCEEIRQTTGLRIHVDIIGFGHKYTDPYGRWRALRGISDSGCLLVRPDAHICWRAMEATPEQTAGLRQGITRLLGRNPI